MAVVDGRFFHLSRTQVDQVVFECYKLCNVRLRFPIRGGARQGLCRRPRQLGEVWRSKRQTAKRSRGRYWPSQLRGLLIRLLGGVVASRWCGDVWSDFGRRGELLRRRLDGFGWRGELLSLGLE